MIFLAVKLCYKQTLFSEYRPHRMEETGRNKWEEKLGCDVENHQTHIGGGGHSGRVGRGRTGADGPSLCQEVVGADVLVGLLVEVVVVTLEEGGEGELEAGHHQVDSQDDPHPLAANLHEVFRLAPGKTRYRELSDWTGRGSLTCWW